MPNLYTISRTFSLHATVTKQCCRILIWTPFYFSDYTITGVCLLSGVETYMYDRVLKVPALIATAWQ